MFVHHLVDQFAGQDTSHQFDPACVSVYISCSTHHPQVSLQVLVSDQYQSQSIGELQLVFHTLVDQSAGQDVSHPFNPACVSVYISSKYHQLHVAVFDQYQSQSTGVVQVFVHVLVLVLPQLLVCVNVVQEHTVDGNGVQVVSVHVVLLASIQRGEFDHQFIQSQYHLYSEVVSEIFLKVQSKQL